MFFLVPGESFTSAHSAVLKGLVATRNPVKIVWRMTGSGPLRLVAHGPGAIVRRPAWQERHSGSTWNRPGAEWGAGIVFPKQGCWRIHASRGSNSGDVWLILR
jgi:hypothetical protein